MFLLYSARVVNRDTLQVSDWLRIPATLLIGTKPGVAYPWGRTRSCVAQCHCSCGGEQKILL